MIKGKIGAVEFEAYVVRNEGDYFFCMVFSHISVEHDIPIEGHLFTSQSEAISDLRAFLTALGAVIEEDGL